MSTTDKPTITEADVVAFVNALAVQARAALPNLTGQGDTWKHRCISGATISEAIANACAELNSKDRAADLRAQAERLLAEAATLEGGAL